MDIEHDYGRRQAWVRIVLAMGIAVCGPMMLDFIPAHAVSGGSVSPPALASSGQAITISYSGKDVTGPASNLVVEQCIAKDDDAGFDADVDCSSLSRQFFYGVPESGQIHYGGRRDANPTAPFVGIDPVNGEWSLCAPDSGVANHQTGYLRVADTPDDMADDLFVPLPCVGGRSVAATGARNASGVPFAAVVPIGLVVALGAAIVITRRAMTSRRQPLPIPTNSHQEERTNR